MAFIPNTELIQSSNSKVSIDYDFDASQGTVHIHDEDFVRFLLVVNVTLGFALFNPAISNRKGTTSKRLLNLDLDTSNCNNGDELLILYEARVFDQTSDLLQHILSELRVTNRILNEVHDLDEEIENEND